jgi:hypothetical protein
MRYQGLVAVLAVLAGVIMPSLIAQPAATQVLVESLPDSPGATLLAESNVWSSSQPDIWEQLTFTEAGDGVAPVLTKSKPCNISATAGGDATESESPSDSSDRPAPCLTYRNQLRPFVTPPARPLTPAGKLHLAIYDLTNPGNLATVAGLAAYTVMTDSHSVYGPGFTGFRRNIGVSLAGEASGELIGTFAVSSLFHQDPRYFRMPQATPFRRVVHAVAHVAVAQGDNGRPMPNFQNLITLPVATVLANLYVPGINGNLPSTSERIVSGFATEPIGNLLAEFLPDIASHIHIHVVIMQRFINQISNTQSMNGMATPALP